MTVVAERRRQLVDDAAADERGDVLGQLVTEVVFPTGAIALGAADRYRLAGVAETLDRLDVQAVTVVGYSDRTGPLSVNTDLSLRRATTVGDVLVDAGLAETDVRVVSALTEGLPLPVPTAEGVSEPRNRAARVFIRTP